MAGNATKRIGIFGHVGNRNLGDEAIISAVIQNIRRAFPEAEICGFTINPQDTEARHGIPSFPIRRLEPQQERSGVTVPVAPSPVGATGQGARQRVKAALRSLPLVYSVVKAIRVMLQAPAEILRELAFLRRCSQRLQGLDLLIIAGSHQLMDYVGGPWAFPYTLWKWCVLARAAAVKVVFLSVGAGPIHSRLGWFLLKHSLRGAEYRSYRDEVSRELIARMGFRRDGVFPDLVYSLDLPQASAAPRNGSARSLVVAINPMPLFHRMFWHQADAPVYEAYVEKVSQFARWLVDRRYSVVLFPTQLRADPLVIQDVLARIQGNGCGRYAQHVIAPSIASFDDLVRELAGADVVVATRFHGVLLSSLLAKPTLCLSYHQKAHAVMTVLDQGDFVVDAVHADLEAWKQCFLVLESRREAVIRELERKLPQFRIALDRQYQTVFRLLKADAGNDVP